MVALKATSGWRWNGQAQRGAAARTCAACARSLGIEQEHPLFEQRVHLLVEAILDEEYRIDIGESAYETPTRAWQRATTSRSSTNGWDAWQIELDGAMQSLRDLRDRVAEMDG